MKNFPNGFTSWMETHHEIVLEIHNIEIETSFPVHEYNENNIVIKTRSEQGTGGIYELAETLTDKFEMKYQGVVWGEELEFFDTLESFIEEELYNQK